MGIDLVEKNCLLVGLLVWELGFESDNSFVVHLFTNLIGALEKKVCIKDSARDIGQSLDILFGDGRFLFCLKQRLWHCYGRRTMLMIWWTLKQEDQKKFQKKFQYQKYVLLRRRFSSVCNFFFFLTNAMYIILSTNKGYTYYRWC